MPYSAPGPFLGAQAATGYQISRSLRFRSSASAYLSRTFGTPTNNKIFTWSGWVKRGAFSTNTTLHAGGASTGTANYVQFGIYADSLSYIDVNTSATVGNYSSVAVLRDPSAWYHIVLKVDTTQATAANRFVWYVNGVSQPVTTVTAYAQNAATNANTSGLVGGIAGFLYNAAWSNFFDGYLAEVNFIDGQALTPSSFGENDATTGVWKPKAYTGTYGTNGFYLKFADNSAATAAAIGKDSSGNGNNWTPTNISVTAGVTYDSMIDTPTPYDDGGTGRGNYAVLNGVEQGNNGTMTLYNGNMEAGTSSTANYVNAVGSIAIPTSGKWYFEFQDLSGISNINVILGLSPATKSWAGLFATVTGSSTIGYSSGEYSFGAGGTKVNAGSSSAYGSSWSTNVIGVAVDMDGQTIVIYVSNVSQGTAFSSIPQIPYKIVCSFATSAGHMVFNFGQRPFTYTPPSGFKALNTQNLP